LLYLIGVCGVSVVAMATFAIVTPTVVWSILKGLDPEFTNLIDHNISTRLEYRPR
jgi:hypothetical protein